MVELDPTTGAAKAGVGPRLALVRPARVVTFGGGVEITMRVAQGFERAGAEQAAHDAVGRIRAGNHDASAYGLTITSEAVQKLDMLAGFLCHIRAMVLFACVVESWNLVDDDDQPIPLTSRAAVATWLHNGATGVGELSAFLVAAEGWTVAEMTEGNGSRPSPNGIGAAASNFANNAELATSPAPTESPA